MPAVSIENVKPGAVLARPIEDSMGRVLINAGEALTPQLIGVLKKRGFVEVDVHSTGASDGEEPELTPRVTHSIVKDMANDEDVIKLNKEIAERFHNISEKNPRMSVIRALATKTLISKIARTKGLA